jgi:hypothetical protein
MDNLKMDAVLIVDPLATCEVTATISEPLQATRGLSGGDKASKTEVDRQGVSCLTSLMVIIHLVDSDRMGQEN